MFKMKRGATQGSIGISGMHMKTQRWQKNIILQTLLCHMFLLHFFNKVDLVHCFDIYIIYTINGLLYTSHITQIVTNVMYE